MTSVFQTFFQIGAAVGLSLLLTVAIPTLLIYKKYIK